MSKKYCLLIDVGNTQVKWALTEEETILVEDQWLHPDDERLLLSRIVIAEVPAHIIVSNVAGIHFKQEIIEWAEEKYSLPVHFVVAPREAFGVRNAYTNPEELGSDRWLALVAAHALYKADVCIVDVGSALTIDLLLANGEHSGGYIMPGFTNMGQALANGTALKLNSHGLQPNTEISPGHSSTACINNGVLIAICGAIECAVKHFEQETGKKLQCVLTGGDATPLSAKLQITHSLEPALVLKGMAMVGNALAQTL